MMRGGEMMKITRITTQKSNQHRYNIYLTDGDQEEFGLSVDENTLIKFNLRKGMELSQEDIERIKSADNIEKSYHDALRYLSYRMRTTKELRDYLQKKTIQAEHIEEIINRLTELDLLNDQQYANMYVTSKICAGTKGPRYIYNELVKKGIPETMIDQALQQYSYTMQLKHATTIAEKRLNRESKHAYQKQLNLVKAYLQRNGFTSEVIGEALASFQNQHDDEQEWAAILYHGEKLWNRYSKRFTGATLLNKVKAGLYRQGFSIEDINKFISHYREENSIH